MDGIAQSVSDNAGKISTIEQKVDGITLSVTNGDTSSTLSIKSGSTTLSSAKIELKGVVTFTDLSTSGSTTINGGNITTGTISGSRIDGTTLVITEGATIAGWNLDENSIYKHSGTWSKGTFMCTGSGGSYSIGGSGSISGWVFGAGGKFGVTSSGSVWCSDLHATGGSIGGWYLGSDYIRSSSGVYGTYKWGDGAVYTSTGYLFTILRAGGLYYGLASSNSYSAVHTVFHSSALISTYVSTGGGAVEL